MHSSKMPKRNWNMRIVTKHLKGMPEMARYNLPDATA
jgi:hypothetical protein